MGFPKFISLFFYLSDNQDREQDPIRVWVRSLIRTQGEKLSLSMDFNTSIVKSATQSSI